MLAASVLAACGGGATRPVVTRPPLISIFEASTQLTASPGPTLRVLRQLGVQYVRVMVVWRSVAPSPGSATAPAHFDAASPAAYPASGWAPYDAIVRDALALHMGVLFNVTGGAPNWALGPGIPHAFSAPGVWRPSAPRFGAFAEAVGTRYSGHYVPPGSSGPLPRVTFWSIWNEPNLGEADLAPQTIDNSTVNTSPVMYRHLLDAGWNALHQTGHGGDRILIGELAPYGQSVGPNVPGTFGYMVPMRFLRALYCVDSSLRPLQGASAAANGCPANPATFVSQNPALLRASGFAVHPYPQGAVPPDVVLDPAADPGGGFVYLATISRLENFLDTVTRQYGVSNPFPIYPTEYGYETQPPFQDGAPVAVTPAYENWAEYLTWRNPRLRSWDHYLLVDPPLPSHFDTGLRFQNGTPKPTLVAFRMPIYLPVTHQSGRALEVWGCARPAHYAPQPQHVEIQWQSGGQGGFATVRSAALDPSCYFDTRVRFRSGGNVRLAWAYPDGPTIYSRVVPITVG
jgi:hypothetical protein